jgi:hypothetical protein
MDPFSFWMQASVFWARVFKQQQDAYLRMLGAVAVKVPHPSAADLSAQAQAQASPDRTPAAKKATAKKPAQSPLAATLPAGKQLDPVTA